MRNALVALCAIVVLALAAPAAEAQRHHRQGGVDWFGGLMEQNMQIVPNMWERYDRNAAYTDWVYTPNRRSRASERVVRREMAAWGQPSYGYGGGYGRAGYGGRGGYGYYSQQLGLPMLGGQYGVGFYGDMNGYGPGFLDYRRNNWDYYTRGGRHRIASRGDVQGWGLANLGVNVGHLVYDIFSNKNEKKRDEAIQSGLGQVLQVMEMQQQQIQMLQMQLQQQQQAQQQAPRAVGPPVHQQFTQAPQPERRPVEVTRTARQQGILVVNPTGCYIDLFELSGTKVLSRSNETVRLNGNSVEGLEFEVVGGGSCNVGLTMSNDGAFATLDCGGAR